MTNPQIVSAEGSKGAGATARSSTTTAESPTTTVNRRQALRVIGAGGVLAAIGVANGSATVADGERAEAGPERGDGEHDRSRRREVLVGVSATDESPGEAIAGALPEAATVVHENGEIHYATVAFDADAPPGAVAAFLDEVIEVPVVKYAERNHTLHAAYVPDDPGFEDQYAPAMVNAPDAWDVTLGSRDVTVAILDSGVEYDHEDLVDAFTDDPGFDFVTGGPDPAPPDPEIDHHGTHVAGIAAAGLDNGVGIAGTSNSTLLAGRVLDSSGLGMTADIADGIAWAAARGADVINLSLGGIEPSRTLQNAVSFAYHSGSFLVATAGNEGRPGVEYPAAYPEVFAVSALDETANLAWYSSFGDRVDVAAPGSNVLSTVPTVSGSYAEQSGTSMAAPLVAGIAALTLTEYDLSVERLRTHLRDTAVDVGLPREQQGVGRVDAGRAVTTPPEDGVGCAIVNQGLGEGFLEERDTSCWRYDTVSESPCRVLVDLDGPSRTDFDLYVNTGTERCPFPDDSTHRSVTLDSQEHVAVDEPDPSTPLLATVLAYRGSGPYAVTFTEYA
ncbi:S8 family serine peptidase [Halorubrum sp. JWXQ-INN 858]|uniref:S8 family serine peptidase n=1 Tax=Halorubrum sp. JWXQ-INN 858 TaxID=2690782 RepID=UPI00135796F2|nr:S8 family serine peptidase [Halorubrum sp. JWXQ-INN 858]MWV63456.1 S8 family serine peptidase [Halorubrum sp. JWXQ-INN 858]